jgi:hypothetical protein
MKRCPQCLFIYPESDARCDFDNTPQRAPASKKSSPGSKKSSRKKGTAITAAVGLAIGIAGFFVYYSLSSRAKDVAEIQPVAVASTATPHPRRRTS